MFKSDYLQSAIVLRALDPSIFFKKFEREIYTIIICCIFQENVKSGIGFNVKYSSNYHFKIVRPRLQIVMDFSFHICYKTSNDGQSTIASNVHKIESSLKL